MALETNIQKLFNVQGLVAVITGGGTGLGLYAAKILDANGAKAVYIVGRREEVLRKAADSAENGTIIPLVGDVTNIDSLRGIVATIEKEQGYVNVVFANAGTTGVCHDPSDDVRMGKIPTLAEFQQKMLRPELLDEFTQVLHINTTAVHYTAMAFLDLLDKGNQKKNVAQESQIIVTTSAAAYERSLLPSLAAYCSAKAATSTLAGVLATKFAERRLHIRVNSIAPGHFPSDLTSGYLSMFPAYTQDGQNGQDAAFAGARCLPREMCPAERSGSPEEFAGVFLFLASRAAAYCNGATLLIDGGLLCK
ncbi:related to dehydrogenases with different specificities (related to short-chain alcohol dehydrogenases) [Ramularia collo-cygni]|uniref:Related to dehydrogenases with different specificities (Related to short-chain alcohol dehydrogenases) n=1 Tax=Ramularia collo-cygni TaxID=112498 RepID=A0A2D3UUA0_9PEZI|nr:related to dehydrogenases with different specificities (related to short-chain alcohol dehydrogenases) [Ramularia collo-cygni]CZT21182.1 related to dehydrogenases with different specificities (related to short-chain alcohol dehydrogenases) [Ramularia collo-cygni]